VAVDQIRVLSRRRMTRKIAQINAADAELLRQLIREMYAEP
jgi:hypothetical protein